MKRVCALLLCILSFSGLMLRKTLADQRKEDHAALTIAQAGATTFEEMQYIGENPEVDVEIRRVDDCTPGWVAQQIEAGDNTIDIFVVRSNMIGYADLINKGYCASLNSEGSILSITDQMNRYVVDAISYQGEICAIPDMMLWDGSICMLCNPEHPLWSRYQLESHHSISDILDMIEDLAERNELDEWWLWNDHEDADRLYNICVIGSINYMEALNEGVDLEQEKYKNLYERFDRMRQEIMERTDPPMSVEPLFYQINMLDESVFSNGNLQPVLVTPFADQEELLPITLRLLILNPNAPNLNEAIRYLRHKLESYTPFQSACLFPRAVEPIENPFEESTGEHWILSPDIINWINITDSEVRVPTRGLMNLFWDNQGLDWEQRYLNGQITIDQYIDYLSQKLAMLINEM